jgi:serine-type D-Ala-D-Ala endopeptidase (penicillin-binding protein 7)
MDIPSVSRRAAASTALSLCLSTAHAQGHMLAAPPMIPDGDTALVSAAPMTIAGPVEPIGFDFMPQVEGLTRHFALSSSSVLVLDRSTREVLVTKAAREVRPIASITKLMTALLVVEGEQPMDEVLQITQADVDTIKNSRSRLRVGARLSRHELLHLALMSSENRAAHALGRNTPGGIAQFVQRMNRRAADLGMSSSRFTDPTGLSDENRSNAVDLARLVLESSKHQVIRMLSTDIEEKVRLGPRRSLTYRTSNTLVRSPRWDIGLQKTGYIREAGRCLVMQASMAGRQVIMVLLDAASPRQRLRDVEHLRRWLESSIAERGQASDHEERGNHGRTARSAR